jgi:hypothetical protein
MVSPDNPHGEAAKVGNVPNFDGIFNEDMAMWTLAKYLDFVNTDKGKDPDKQHKFLNHLLQSDVGFGLINGDNWKDYVAAYNFLSTAARHHDSDKVNVKLPSHPKAQVLWIDLPHNGQKFAQLHYGELTKEHYRIPRDWDIPSQNVFLHRNEYYIGQDEEVHKHHANRRMNLVKEHNPMNTEERISMFKENRETAGFFNSLWYNVKIGGLKLWKGAGDVVDAVLRQATRP